MMVSQGFQEIKEFVDLLEIVEVQVRLVYLDHLDPLENLAIQVRARIVKAILRSQLYFIR